MANMFSAYCRPDFQTNNKKKLQPCLFVVSLSSVASGSSAWVSRHPVAPRLCSSAYQRFRVLTPNLSPSLFPTLIKASTVKPGETSKEPYSKFCLSDESIKMAAVMIVATSGTFALNNILNLGPILASSVTGLMATMMLPEKLALVALCGSFGGMARMAVIPGIVPSFILGVVTLAMMYVFNENKWLVGVGGRLGFIAQCACTLQFVLSSLFIRPLGDASLIGTYPALRILIQQLPVMILFTIIGAFSVPSWKKMFSSNVQNHKYSQLIARISNSIAAVSITGLVSALVLPPAAAGPAFCGSLIAMSVPTKLPSKTAMLAACIMGALSQVALVSVMLGGWGGKLGTAALIGVISYNLAAKAVRAFILFMQDWWLRRNTKGGELKHKSDSPYLA